ncbi:hypothetical protein IscW_ISCW014732, partial [Ixodes scapularis]
KKTMLAWSQHRQTAFNQLKRRLTIAPILAYPDFSLPLNLDTDACDQDFGAV